MTSIRVTMRLAAALVTTVGLTAQAADQPTAGTIAKAWETQANAVEALQVTYLFFARKAIDWDPKKPDREPDEDVPPIDPSAHNSALSLRIYHKSGIKESLEQWRLNDNALQGKTHTGSNGHRRFFFAHDFHGLGSANVTPARPQGSNEGLPEIPCVLLDGDMKRAYEALKDGKATISRSKTPSGSDAILVSWEWGGGATNRVSPRYAVLLDPVVGYAPVEYKSLLGETVRGLRRWSQHIQVIKGVWVPQEFESYLASDSGRILVRNKSLVLACLVNGVAADGVYESTFPAGTFVSDEIENTEYTVGEDTGSSPGEKK